MPTSTSSPLDVLVPQRDEPVGVSHRKQEHRVHSAVNPLVLHRHVQRPASAQMDLRDPGVKYRVIVGLGRMAAGAATGISLLFSMSHFNLLQISNCVLQIEQQRRGNTRFFAVSSPFNLQFAICNLQFISSPPSAPAGCRCSCPTTVPF